MATSRVLTMQFISGYKLNEYGALRRAGADLKDLTGIVCDALAHQMYVPSNCFTLASHLLSGGGC
jgi:predicted unusual protein kinase regulating ubiquinone biosynthesis (AarF/ABC1/UbiB family)